MNPSNETIFDRERKMVLNIKHKNIDGKRERKGEPEKGIETERER